VDHVAVFRREELNTEVFDENCDLRFEMCPRLQRTKSNLNQKHIYTILLQSESTTVLSIVFFNAE